MELRLAFDTVPELFDRYRPRYCAELFSDLIAYTDLGPGKRVLELGPGTGQATDPILATGCDYLAIELGVNLYEKMISKYSSCPNFSIINDDFITHDFGYDCFDLIYSAATIQWIPEETAFRKTFSLLKPGGTLAMMLTRGDYRTPNEKLYSEIQAVYEKYYRPETPYTHGSFRYTAAVEYGFTDMEKREYQGCRRFSDDTLRPYRHSGTVQDETDRRHPRCDIR